MSQLFLTLSVTLAAIIGTMSLVWLLSVVKRDASVIDPFWGLGFAVVALVAYLLNCPATLRTTLIVALTCAWGLRLSLYLLAQQRPR